MIQWMNTINEILDSKNIPNKLLEKLVGFLNHIGFIIPTSRYLINRIRNLQRKSIQWKFIGLSKAER